MARRKKSGGGGPNWLDTYADMVTLLLTFFVMLFAMSSMDSDKWRLLVEAFSAHGSSDNQIVINPQSDAGTSELGPTDPAGIASAIGPESEDTGEVLQFDELYAYLKQYVEEHDLESSVELHKGDDYTFMTFRDNIFFEGDSAELLPNGKEVLDILCDAVAGIKDQINEIRFYGHTAHVGDSYQKANQEFDRRLSVDRATNVLLYVQLKGVIEPKKLVSEGYGEWRPIAPQDGNEENRRKNRRVEIYISKVGTDRNRSLNDIYDEMSSAPAAPAGSGPAGSTAGSPAGTESPAAGSESTAASAPVA